MKDTGDYQFDAASPLMTAASKYGLDVQKIIEGNPAEIAKAQGLGIPVPGAAPGPAASTPPVVQSALATGAAGQTSPAPSGTSANQPQPPAPSIAQNDTPSYTPGFALDFGRNLAQAQVPATNAPNPPTDTTGAPTVPASISPTGTATSPLAQALSSAQDTERQIKAMPTEAQTLAQDESDKAKLMSPESAKNPTGIPSPYSPAYRPTKWQRVGRGVLGGLEGLAEHGIAGAALGVVDPAAVGAKAYGAPNRAYSTAEAVNQQGLARVNSQEATAEKTYTADTARLKDLLTAQSDLTKAAAAGETADIKNRMADVANQVAEVRGRLADAAQARAVADQTRADAATTNASSNEIRASADLIRAEAARSGADKSAFAQPILDEAQSQIDKLNDYEWDPTYVGPGNEQGGFFSSESPGKVYTVKDFTQLKNKAIADANVKLARIKQPRLRYPMFDVAATTPGRGTAAAAPAATTPAATANVQPPASLLAKTPENGVVVGRNGETWMKKGGQWTAPPKQ